MIEGVLNIDKESGMSSHDVVNRVRRACQTRRVGHAGTLDPLATGVLLVCVGRATRLVEYLVGQTKVYEGTVRLGEATNTYDAEGEIVAKRPLPTNLTPSTLHTSLDPFRGEILQKPPMYSAIKKDGQPLYKLARQGKTVDIPARQVTIYALDVLQVALPDVQVRITCSSGTYIRSLAHDWGQALGCGGHLVQLQRTHIGEFAVTDSLKLADLSLETAQKAVFPSDMAVQHLPKIDLTEWEVGEVSNGRRIPILTHHPQTELVRVYGTDGRFLGLLIKKEAEWQPKKMFT